MKPNKCHPMTIVNPTLLANAAATSEAQLATCCSWREAMEGRNPLPSIHFITNQMLCLGSLAMFFIFALVSCSLWRPGLCLHCNRTLDKPALYNLKKLSVPSRLRTDGELLAPILIKRVSGTDNNTRVREFIKGQFEKLKWHVEIDSFEEATPLKSIQFHNIIATKNFKAPRKLVFAAHYDSKYFSPPDDNFVAATDSAVSCAILIDLAISLDALLDKQKDNSVSIQFVFFDGEEAFENWSDEDSVYGAR